MPRAKDPDRYRERRNAILEEAYRQFASSGYERTTTASICRGAGISSGTFFHYFPTKLEALVGILGDGVQATVDALARIGSDHRGLDAILAYAGTAEEEMRDPHFGGFVHAVSGVAHLPEVASALAAESAVVSDFLVTHAATAAVDGRVRQDVDAEVLARWVRWILDGAAEHAVGAQVRPGELVRAVRALVGAPSASA